MRVITGTARGRVLKELEGLETRPTTGKVKESLFSIIQFDIEGRRVLDLFAGTGQLGIEALSRGAAECVFIDRRADAVKLIQEIWRCAVWRTEPECGRATRCPICAAGRSSTSCFWIRPTPADFCSRR